MKSAFVCCIHANVPALEAVDRAIAAARPDRVFCLGDVVGYGAQPRECVQLVRARGWPTILGNHEAAVVDPDTGEEFNPVARLAIDYTIGAVGDAEREWIRSLPETLETPEFQLAHGSTAGRRPFTYVLKPEDATAARVFAVRPIVFIGHTHIAGAWHGPDQRWLTNPAQTIGDMGAVVNVGSVGQPRDKDPRACWVEYDDVTREVRWHRVEYPVEQAQQRIRDAGLPEKLAYRLGTGT